MNTLFEDPTFSAALRALEARADASDRAARDALAAVSDGERAALRQMIREEPQRFYLDVANELFLSVSPATRTLLYVLARSCRARSIVEFGTSFGLSSLYLAAALRDNGGGKLVSAEFVPSKAASARETFIAASVADLIEVREGDALVTLARDLPAQIDLVLLDGAKPLYRTVLALLEPRLREGALVLADNIADAPGYAAFVRDPRSGYRSVPFNEDVELSLFARR